MTNSSTWEPMIILIPVIILGIFVAFINNGPPDNWFWKLVNWLKKSKGDKPRRTLTKHQIDSREDAFFLLCILILSFFIVLILLKISWNYIGVIS